MTFFFFYKKQKPAPKLNIDCVLVFHQVFRASCSCHSVRGATFSTSLAAVRLFALTSTAGMKATQEGLPSLIYLKQSPGLFNVCLFTLVHSRQLLASQSAATLTASCCKMSLLDTSFTFLYVPRGSFSVRTIEFFWVW